MTSKVEAILRMEFQEPHSVWLEDPREIRVAAQALRNLAALDPTHAGILENRLFEGRSAPEIAAILGLPLPSVERLWLAIRAWTLREIARGNPDREEIRGSVHHEGSARRS